MGILITFLLIFSFTPFLLWTDQYKKIAIGQIPFIVGAWYTFIKYMTIGIAPSEGYLWILLILNLIYGHIAFTIILLETRKSIKLRQSATYSFDQ